MASITLPVPVNPGVGAWVPSAALGGPYRTFQAAGDTPDDLITIQGSINGVDAYPILDVFGSGEETITDNAEFYRAVRTGGSGSGFAGVANALALQGPPGPPGPTGPTGATGATGAAGPPTLGDLAWTGTLTTNDAAPTPIPSPALVTVFGAFGPAGFIPALDGVYSIITQGSEYCTDGPDAGTGSSFFFASSFIVASGVVTQLDFTPIAGVAGPPGLVAATDGSAIEIVATGVALDTIDWKHNSAIQYVG